MTQEAQEPAPGRNYAVDFDDGGWRAHGLFLFLTVLFSGSVVFHPFDVPLAPPLADPAQTQWNFWWIDQVLRGAWGEHADLMHSPALFHPLGANLAYHTLDLGYGLLLWPVRLIGGGLLQHNVALMLATYLMAWFTWLATRQLGGSRFAAALASVVLTLHGYRLAEAHHLNTFSTYFFPLTLYLLARIGSGNRPLLSGALLGLTGCAAVATSLFHAMGCALVACLYIPFLWSDARERRSAMLGLAAAAVVAAPVVAWMAWQLHRAPAPVEFSVSDQARNAADLWQLLIHPRLRMALTGTENDYMGLVINTGQRVLIWYLPGYLPVALGLIAAFRAGAWPGLASSRRVLLIGAVAFILAGLGPFLKVGSPAEVNPGATGIPLPGRLLAFVPMLGTLRSVWHFAFLGTICLGIYASILGMEWLERIADPRRRVLLQLLLVVLAGAESFIGPLTTYGDRMEGAARFLKAAAPRESAVAVFPQYIYQLRGHFMYQQTIHGRPIMGGYISRDPVGFEEWKKERRWPIELEELGYGRIPVLDGGTVALLREDIGACNMGSVMIHDDSEDQRFAARIGGALARLGIGDVVYTDRDGVVVAIRR